MATGRSAPEKEGLSAVKKKLGVWVGARRCLNKMKKKKGQFDRFYFFLSGLDDFFEVEVAVAEV